MGLSETTVPVRSSHGIARVTGNPDLLRLHAALFAAGSALLALVDMARSPGQLWFLDVVLPWGALLACHAWWVVLQRGRANLPAQPLIEQAEATGAPAAVETLAPAAVVPQAPLAAPVAARPEPQIDQLAADLAKLRAALGRGELWDQPVPEGSLLRASAPLPPSGELPDSVLALWGRPAPRPGTLAAGPSAPPASPARSDERRNANRDLLQLGWV